MAISSANQWHVENLVQSLAEAGTSQVPSRYVLPPPHRPFARPIHSGDAQIPLIDLSMPDASQRIARACEEWGFFQVMNHGVPAETMNGMRKAVKGFFDLPLEERLRWSFHSSAAHPAGYGRNYDFDGKPLNWVDILKHNVSPPSLTDKNRWPFLPRDYREVAEAYGREIMKLMDSLLAVISQNLGFRPSWLKEAVGEDAVILLRSNYYPPCPQPELVTGLLPHSDAGILTVLQQEEGEDGLQVQKGSDWFAVNPIKGALTINIGDMLQLMSNGKYESMYHRVVTRKEKSRLSIATFMFAEDSTLLKPPKVLVDEAHPRLYRDITSKDYMQRLRKEGIGNKHIIESLKLGREVKPLL